MKNTIVKTRFARYLLPVWLCLPVTVMALPAATGHQEPVRALPAATLVDTGKARLGERLFADKRLSADQQTACIDCHQLEHGGASGRTSDTSHNDPAIRINTPAIFNVRYNFRQNWDGSRKNLAEQTESILEQPSPGQALDQVLDRLREDENISQQFSKVFRSGLNRQTLIDSLVEYQKSLTTPNSRFDRFLSGDESALDDTEKQGYQLFKSLGCSSCHQGINVGGNLYQKFGVFYNYIAERGHATKADLGRFNVTGRESDKYVFKVPSLRNIAVTSPYLHDGSAESLEQAIYIIGKTQLGRNLDSEQVRLLKAFLLTLTGKYQDKTLSDTVND